MAGAAAATPWRHRGRLCSGLCAAVALACCPPVRPTPPPAIAFLRQPDRYAEKLSPDGRGVAYLSAADGRPSLWVCEFDGTRQPRRISAEGGPSVATFFWTEAGASLTWVAAGPGGRPRIFSRRLDRADFPLETTIAAEGGVTVEAIADAAPPAAILAVRPPSSPFANLHRLEIGSGRISPLVSNTFEILDWEIDVSGTPRAGVRVRPDGSRELVSLAREGPGVIYRAGPGESFRPLRLSPDGASLLVLTDGDSDGDLGRVERVHLRTGHRQLLAADPLGRVDVEEVVVDPVDGCLLGAACWDGGLRWVFCDANFGAERAWVESRIGGAPIFRDFSRDGAKALVEARDGGLPGPVYLYDRARRAIRRLWDSRPSLPSSEISPTRPISYPARDGTIIPGYLTLPLCGRAPHPLVVFPHGGPRMRTYGWFDGRVQFLASRGYAVLQPNYRGSRGYGRSFANAGNRGWGTGVMQHDITDGVEHLVRKGIADRDRVAILGGSYGGYAALAGLAFTSDLYAAGVCLFGPSDLVDYALNLPVKWHPLIGMVREQLGDPRLESDMHRLRSQSPLYAADRIRAPVLIYQGGRDEIVRRSHSDRMVAELRRCGARVTYLLDEAEGHGFSTPEKEAAVYERIEAFLGEHLGAPRKP